MVEICYFFVYYNFNIKDKQRAFQFRDYENEDFQAIKIGSI